jgi:adenosylhomocysteine nucleosidase
MTTPWPGRVGLIAPMPSEFRPLIKALSLQRVKPDDKSVYVGVAGNTELVATTSGIGTKLATGATERLLDTTPVDHVMIVGIAGGMGTAKVGDLITPALVVDKDSGREFAPDYLDYARTPRGKLVSSDDFGMDTAETDRLVADGFVAVDMETAAVAAVCVARGVKWSPVRVISDLVGVTPVDAIDLANPDGTANTRAAVGYLLKHPTRIPKLLRLGRESMAAASKAAATVAQTLHVTR